MESHNSSSEKSHNSSSEKSKLFFSFSVDKYIKSIFIELEKTKIPPKILLAEIIIILESYENYRHQNPYYFEPVNQNDHDKPSEIYSPFYKKKLRSELFLAFNLAFQRLSHRLMNKKLGGRPSKVTELRTLFEHNNDDISKKKVILEKYKPFYSRSTIYRALKPEEGK